VQQQKRERDRDKWIKVILDLIHFVTPILKMAWDPYYSETLPTPRRLPPNRNGRMAFLPRWMDANVRAGAIQHNPLYLPQQYFDDTEERDRYVDDFIHRGRAAGEIIDPNWQNIARITADMQGMTRDDLLWEINQNRRMGQRQIWEAENAQEEARDAFHAPDAIRDNREEIPTNGEQGIRFQRAANDYDQAVRGLNNSLDGIGQWRQFLRLADNRNMRLLPPFMGAWMRLRGADEPPRRPIRVRNVRMRIRPAEEVTGRQWVRDGPLEPLRPAEQRRSWQWRMGRRGRRVYQQTGAPVFRAVQRPSRVAQRIRQRLSLRRR